jgi:uncharacterized protein YegL
MPHIGVYFLLDVSASMYGVPLQVMYEAYEHVGRRLLVHQHLLEFSVLAYESQLIEICRSQNILPPLAPFAPAGASRMGMALAQVFEWLNTDLQRLPNALLVLIADEVGNDRWQDQCRQFDTFDNRVTFIAIGCQYPTTLNSLCHVARVFSLQMPNELDTWLYQFMRNRY